MTIRSTYALALCLALSNAPLAHAEKHKKTLEERIPAHLSEQDNSFFTFTIENDFFGSGQDENYTNGARLTYYDDRIEPLDIVRQLGNAVPFFDVNGSTNIYYSVGQNLYTPENILTRTPDPTDRPYAAFLYGSVGYQTLSKNHLEDVELTLGVVGPAALGKGTQKFVHDLFNMDNPSGWDSQLENEPGIIVAYQRSWPEAYAANLDPFYLRIAPHIGFSAGNIYTYGATGITLQLVPEEHKWQAPPPRIRPAIPGSGYFSVPDDRFSWSLFAGVEGRAVGRNIFLDGNTFSNSASVDKKHLVLDANAGLTLTYGRTQIAYTLNWRSDEFVGQNDNSLFGSVSLGYRF